MKNIAKKTITIGFACMIGLLLTTVTVMAQTAPTGTVTNTYAAKFICGVQKDAQLHVVPDAQAGHYSSKINVHNNTGIHINFRKKIIPLKGGQVPTAPAWMKLESLRPDWAMEVVCRDIYNHLGIPIWPQIDANPPYIEGFVVFEVFFVNPIQPGTVIPFDPLDVAGIYTYRAEPAGTDAVAIDITVYPAKSNRYTIPLTVPADPIVIGPASGSAKRQ
ncbi:MAG TPA: hypothetical protein VF290_08520 [Pyrinomonadaceae bacterium]